MSFIRIYLNAWTKSFGSQLMSLSTLVLSYSLLLFIANGAYNFNTVLQGWGKDFKINVYLKNVTEVDKSNLEKKLAIMSELKNYRLISKQEEINNISKSLSDTFIDGLELDEIVPETYELTLRSSIVDNPKFSQMLQSLVNTLKADELVEDVSYGENWLQNYAHLVGAVSKFFLLLTLVLFLLGLYVVSGITRSSISDRREEIEILEVIGATKSFIRTPYYIEVGINALIAIVASLSINFIIFDLIQKNLKQNPMFVGLPEHLSFFKFEVVIGLISACVFLSLGVCYLTIKKINNGWSAATRINY